MSLMDSRRELERMMGSCGLRSNILTCSPHSSLPWILRFARKCLLRMRIRLVCCSCVKLFSNVEQCNNNVALFEEVIVLRDEAARLLGYPDWASFRIEDKMAKTPKTVNDFLEDLKVQLAPGGVKETEHLLDLKSSDLKSRGLEASNDGNYYLWDSRFYGRMMIEQEFSIDEQKIAEYFPLQPTIEGMLNIFEKLFGLVFVIVEGEERSKIAGKFVLSIFLHSWII